ncbi:MAG: hypothetical protein Tsb009_36280 [Planctomycetaceae bacterium]
MVVFAQRTHARSNGISDSTSATRQVGHLPRRCFVLVSLLVVLIEIPQLQAAEETYRVERDLVYSKPDGKPLHLDAYLPAGKGPFPAVLVVHGGAWMSGSKRQLGRYARALAKNGYAAFSINYRLAPKFKFPAQIEDCRAALLWVRRNAKKYSLDPNRVGAIGYSAGGHLVALLGVTGKVTKQGKEIHDTRLQCVCAGGAPCEFRHLPENSRSLKYWLGGTRKDIPKIYEAASPIAHVTKHAPPMFFFHGEKDRLVNVNSPKAMVEMLKQKKVHSEIHVLENAGHIATALTPDCIRRSIDFFNRHLKKQTSEQKKQQGNTSSIDDPRSSSSFISLNKPAQRPNIVFFLIDDMGWKDVGFMGSRYYETPHIDKLAKQGMIFTNAYSNGPNCAPTRACLMSGQYSPRHGIYTVGNSNRGNPKLRKLIPIKNTTVLRDGIVTLAESLRNSGYESAHFGKWHLGDDPRTQGFDLNIAGNKSGSPRGGYFSPYRNPQLTNGPRGEYLTDRLTDEAIRFMKKKREKPFFLYLAHYAVHTPIQAKESLINKYRSKQGHNGQNNPTYAAMVESVDQSVGRILQTLEQLKLTENTIVIFTSDNGGYGPATSMTPLRGSKGMLYEGGVRVPLTIRWPARIQPGTRCETPVMSIDFYPTLMQAAGIARAKSLKLDGQSLLPLLKQIDGWKPRSIFWHFPAYLQAYRGITGPFRTRPAGAIRRGDYKLIEFFEDSRLELYNLKTDIGETNNLAKSQPELVKQLHDELKAWRKSVNAPIPRKLNPQYDPTFKPKKKRKRRRKMVG